jgi:hypothetical protein
MIKIGEERFMIEDIYRYAKTETGVDIWWNRCEGKLSITFQDETEKEKTLEKMDEAFGVK